MSIEVPHLKMKFIDSMNFIPEALSKIPKAFNLSELAKGYFPHLFNKCENQKIILNRLPDINYYNPGGMMPEDGHKFIAMNISTTVSILKKRLSNIADMTVYFEKRMS